MFLNEQEKDFILLKNHKNAYKKLCKSEMNEKNKMLGEIIKTKINNKFFIQTYCYNFFFRSLVIFLVIVLQFFLEFKQPKIVLIFLVLRQPKILKIVNFVKFTLNFFFHFFDKKSFFFKYFF